MSGEYANAYLRLLHHAGIRRYEHVHGQEAGYVAQRLQAANDLVGFSPGLDVLFAAERLVRQAQEHGSGEIHADHFPVDADPGWGPGRLEHTRDFDDLVQRGGQSGLEAGGATGRMAEQVDYHLPGNTDLDYGWGGKPTGPPPGTGGGEPDQSGSQRGFAVGE